jgi:hypothetical protein
MNPAEESFVRSIKERVRTRTIFRLAVIEGVCGFMGETPAEVLLFSIGEAALNNPALFVRGLSKIFGQGALPVYDAIMEVAEDPSWVAERELEAAELKAEESRSLPASYQHSLPRTTTYLHDHRIPDDFSEEDLH